MAGAGPAAAGWPPAGRAKGLAGTGVEPLSAAGGVAAGSVSGRAATMAAKRVVYRAFIRFNICLDRDICKPLGRGLGWGQFLLKQMFD